MFKRDQITYLEYANHSKFNNEHDWGCVLLIGLTQCNNALPISLISIGESSIGVHTS
jgi:hypothetical protein